MNTLNGTYKIGEPSDYSSIYGYQKRRFPVIDAASGNQVGYVKEEKVLNGDGTTASQSYYTRNISRPTNAKRFYASPEALVEAFGGKIYRTVVELPTLVVEAEGDTGGKSRSPLALKRAANKAAKITAAEAEEAKLLEEKAARKTKRLAKKQEKDAAIAEAAKPKKNKRVVQKYV